jgi:alpha-tubulin suppressor-like RCC1 family protein
MQLGYTVLGDTRDRRAGILVALAACGRVGFDARTTDGNSDGSPDVPTSTGASKIVAYGDQTCALVAGDAYCWGHGFTSPTRVPLPAGTVTDMGLGEMHGCFVHGDAVDCFGSDTGSYTLSGPIHAIGGGRGFTCVLVNGAVECWGANDVGQLCTGDMTPTSAPTVSLLASNVTALSVGDDHGCAVVGGQAKCWGHNDNGTLGFGSTVPDHETMPVIVTGIATLPLIAGWHACTLVAGGVKCWGRGDHGELGGGGTADSSLPVLVPSFSGITALATGGGPTDFDASCAIVPPSVYCWGAGLFGRLGQGIAQNEVQPQKVQGLPDGAVEIAIGYDHACARFATGEVWCWGRGDMGQLGDGKGTDSLVPVRVVLGGA